MTKNAKSPFQNVSKVPMTFEDRHDIYNILRNARVRRPFGLFDESGFGKSAVTGWCKLAAEFNAASRSIDKFYVIKNGPDTIGYFGAGPDEEDPGRWEIGYFLDHRYQGNGIVSHIVADFVKEARRKPEIHTLYAVVKPDNHASQSLLEKAGFVRNGVDNDWTPVVYHQDGQSRKTPPIKNKMNLFELRFRR